MLASDKLPDLRPALKAIAWGAGLLATIAGGATGWVALGWWTPASRFDVREEGRVVREELGNVAKVIRDDFGKAIKVVVELARAERFRRIETRNGLKNRRAAPGIDAALADTLDRLIQIETDAVEEIEERISALERLRGP